MYLRVVATKSPFKRTEFRRSEFFNGLLTTLLGSGWHAGQSIEYSLPDRVRWSVPGNCGR